MTFWKTRLGALTILALLGLAVWLGGATVLVHRATMPERETQEMFDFASMRMRVEEVEFASTDGVKLSGWWMPGNAEAAPVVLCHDVDSSKQALVPLAIALRKAGHPVLVFDFRGHGDSGGQRSSLGLMEKRDLLGALDWLAERGDGKTPAGLFGAGMGAHAAVLAAAERRDIHVLVLDGLYPDVPYALVRRVAPDMRWARVLLGGISGAAFFAFHGSAPGGERAADLLPTLSGRDVLMLAPATDSSLSEEMRAMVAALPAEADSDGNLVVVPATLGGGLYGEQVARYHERVAGFFHERLGAPTVARAGW